PVRRRRIPGQHAESRTGKQLFIRGKQAAADQFDAQARAVVNDGYHLIAAVGHRLAVKQRFELLLHMRGDFYFAAGRTVKRDYGDSLVGQERVHAARAALAAERAQELYEQLRLLDNSAVHDAAREPAVMVRTDAHDAA